MAESIFVTKSFMPPQDEYIAQLNKIWENNILTNRGPLTIELEEKLRKYLAIENIIITNNGTIPLQIALKKFGNSGEIITTPFSYIATSSSIVWEGCKPVYVDIHPDYLTINENEIENAITTKTTAILATHVFGNPCNVDLIGKIAKKHNLFVIYDAAHCFGVKLNGSSIFNYGDISTCSFHATKLFHTGEGGALFFKESSFYDELFYAHNFGHDGPLDFFGLGINGKISELNSAMGLSVLPHMQNIVEERQKIVRYYDENIIGYRKFKLRENTDWNFSYYPIIFDSETQLLKVQKKMNEMNIFPRRYFYPSLNTINYLSGQDMPISESISKRILCLPLYVGLLEKELEKIISILRK